MKETKMKKYKNHLKTNDEEQNEESNSPLWFIIDIDSLPVLSFASL